MSRYDVGSLINDFGISSIYLDRESCKDFQRDLASGAAPASLSARRCLQAVLAAWRLYADERSWTGPVPLAVLTRTRQTLGATALIELNAEHCIRALAPLQSQDRSANVSHGLNIVLVPSALPLRGSRNRKEAP
ncbi:hypothetical protein Bbelb_264620 [Branchiostoma belcheri]|nr:hypothetical protein Bbelb_264620 [Branchiostoma belcheri]